jgi:hypothetical protein
MSIVVALITTLNSACQPSVSHEPSAGDLLAQLQSQTGSRRLANALVEDKTLNVHILTRICSGNLEWLAVARKLYPTNYAHLNEEISSAVAVALVTSPGEVLRTFGTEACHLPDDLPSSCDIADWPRQATAALVDLSGDPDVASAREECLALLSFGSLR